MAATVKLIRGDGTSYSQNPNDSSKNTGTAELHVIGASSRSDAISAAVTAYPNHPDDAALPMRGRTAVFVGFDGAATQVWHIFAAYGFAGSSSSNITGLFNEAFHGANYTNADRHRYSVTYRDADTTLNGAIAARFVGTGPNGEPLEGYDATITDRKPTGDVVVTNVDYQFPQLSAQPIARTATKTKSFPKIPGFTLRAVLDTALDTDTPITDLPETVKQVKLPLVEVRIRSLSIAWRSNTSLNTFLGTAAGQFNSGSYTVNNTTYAAGTLYCAGADEVDNGASAAVRYEGTLLFIAYPEKKMRYEVSVAKDDVIGWYYVIQDPWGGMEAAFPALPDYIP